MSRALSWFELGVWLGALAAVAATLTLAIGIGDKPEFGTALVPSRQVESQATFPATPDTRVAPGSEKSRASAPPQTNTVDELSEVKSSLSRIELPPNVRITVAPVRVAIQTVQEPADASVIDAPNMIASIWVNQCEAHRPGTAEFRECRKAEAKRLAEGCKNPQSQLHAAALRQATDLRAFARAYCQAARNYTVPM